MDRLLRNNTFVKIIALLLAIALWFVVNMESPQPAPFKQTTETYRISEVALTAKVNKDRFAIVKMPKMVTVELKGPPSLLNQSNISAADYEVYVDLLHASKGTHVVPVSYTGFPKGVTVRVIPDKVEVTLEEIQKVEKEVSVQYIGHTSDGYSTGEAIVKPKKVHVTLPDSQVKNIGQVQASVNIEGAEDGIDQTVPLRVLDKNGNPMNADISPPVVELNVPVTSPFETIPVKLNYVNKPPDGTSIAGVNLKTEDVTVYGPKNIIEKMTYYPGPQIDLSTVTENQRLQLKLPEVPGIVKVDPEYIELEIKVENTKERVFESIPVKINGLGGGLHASFEKPENGVVNLTVKGTPEKVNALTPDDIELYVDVSNLPPGSHEVPIQMNLPTFITSSTPSDSLHATVLIQ